MRALFSSDTKSPLEYARALRRHDSESLRVLWRPVGLSHAGTATYRLSRAAPYARLSAAHVEAFLSYLAVTQHVSASTRNLAKAALLFLYKEVLDVGLPWIDEIVQAKVSRPYPRCDRSFWFCSSIRARASFHWSSDHSRRL